MENHPHHFYYSRAASQRRPMLVLPTSLLEKELAQASEAVQNHHRMKSSLRYQHKSVRGTTTGSSSSCIPEENEDEEEGDEYGDDDCDHGDENTGHQSDDEGTEEDKEEDEARISPEELLRRARARLLEDLVMEGKMAGDGRCGSTASSEKGSCMAMPHSFEKYREVRANSSSSYPSSSPSPPQGGCSHTWFSVVLVFPFVLPQKDLQPRRPDRHLHSLGTGGHSGKIPPQALSPRLEQEDTI